MENMEEQKWGYDHFFADQTQEYPGLFPARIITGSREIYRVRGGNGEMAAVISGKLHHNAVDAGDFPAVGDWVMVDRADDREGPAIICHILTRKSLFVRKSAGTGHGFQVVAANVDTIFICMALTEDFNLRRLERYLAIAWDSGAVPVVVLTKADLCFDLSRRIAEVADVAPGADVVVVSSQSGYEEILSYIAPEKTIALIGSSGVGKSTIINHLLGEAILATGDIREDGKGRHTTTVRQLLLLPGGGLVIDNPGMRELHLDAADLSKAFADIEALAVFCKYRDCGHGAEPGCAVQRAVASGELSLERLESYQKLQREMSYEGLNFRQLEEEKIRRMFGGKNEMKQTMREIKKKNKR